jgi:plasmid maintenance system killer protein
VAQGTHLGVCGPEALDIYVSEIEPSYLLGSRAGQMSIRINDQWRICFYFNNGEATEVSITDYH